MAYGYNFDISGMFRDACGFPYGLRARGVENRNGRVGGNNVGYIKTNLIVNGYDLVVMGIVRC